MLEWGTIIKVLLIVFRNCCKNTTVEPYYNDNAENGSGIGYYYLNNFESLPIAGRILKL